MLRVWRRLPQPTRLVAVPCVISAALGPSRPLPLPLPPHPCGVPCLLVLLVLILVGIVIMLLCYCLLFVGYQLDIVAGFPTDKFYMMRYLLCVKLYQDQHMAFHQLTKLEKLNVQADALAQQRSQLNQKNSISHVSFLHFVTIQSL